MIRHAKKLEMSLTDWVHILDNKKPIFKANRKNSPGVDVMIMIFCDFWHFSAKMACYDQIA
jgi:hypothetical protein